jgi:hypothetical protein
MSSQKLYSTRQEFLKNATNFLEKNTPIGTQTGWKEFSGGYIHYVNGHMENDPILGVSVLKYGIDDNLITEEFREKGHRHKLDGPAVVEYSSNGSVLKKEYYIEGVSYSEDRFYSANNSKKFNPTFFVIGKLKIKISELEKRFDSFLKKDSNGVITNIKAITEAEKNQFGIKYEELDKNTIYVNDYVIFKNVYDGITPTTFEISYDGMLTKPRYYKNSHQEIIFWGKKAFEPDRNETSVPLWIELQEFPKLGIKPETNIPEYNGENIKSVLEEFLSPFNKNTVLSYVFQGNFFHIVKDFSNRVLFEKRIPLKPNLIKDNTEIDMSWEKEPETFRKATYIAGITSKPINISKEEYEINCKRFSEQQYSPQISGINLANFMPMSSPTQVSTTSPIYTMPQLSENVKTIGSQLIEPQNKLESTEKNKETSNKVIQIAKSDAKEVAKRIAAKQITLFVHNMLVEFLSKKQKKTKSEIEKFFMSENGKIILGFSVGALLPLITNHFPEKYKDVLLELSSEFRIQAETEIALNITETIITPFMHELVSRAGAFQFFSGNNVENIRVTVDGDLTVPSSGSKVDIDEALVEIYHSKTNKTLN